ncbi:MAG TPA: C4-type zinc ribbon domain-containing protein [Verrucomicrobiae bacterium]|nr:C4-type zinc ribbon domain-containing protein [Verrucomicrobiae bacterium]
MSDHITNLLKLQALDFEEITEPNSASLRAELRNIIPQPILAHYDRLVVRGKKGVAIVRNQVCTGCHMRLPIGTINTVLQRTDIQLCDSCGRYLYIPEQAPAPVAEAAPTPQTKPSKAPKTRKRKALAQAPA